MKATRIFLVAVLAFVVANCADQGPLGVTADQPTSGAVAKVTTGPQKDLLGGLLGGLGLLKCSPLPPATSTATIGPLGGTLKVGPHTLVVPAGALANNVTITGALASGSYNAVTFQPEGLQFAKSASLTMSYANCGLVGFLLPKHIAYTNDNYVILELLNALGGLLSSHVTAQIHHFSHYAVAW